MRIVIFGISMKYSQNSIFSKYSEWKLQLYSRWVLLGTLLVLSKKTQFPLVILIEKRLYLVSVWGSIGDRRFP